MRVRSWYEVDALMADLTVHRHMLKGQSEGEIEQSVWDLHPQAVAVLANRRKRTKAVSGMRR